MKNGRNMIVKIHLVVDWCQVLKKSKINPIKIELFDAFLNLDFKLLFIFLQPKKALWLEIYKCLTR